MEERITVLQALKMVMQACKAYTDDNAVIFERDGLEIPGIIDNQYPSLETEDDTLIGAINELHAEVMMHEDLIDITEEEMTDMLSELYKEED